MKIYKIVLTFFFFGLFHSAQAKIFETQKWQTSNQVPVIFYQAKEVPMLDIELAFAAGSAYDDQAFGLSALTTDLLSQGNAGLSATDIAEHLADTGAQFNAEGSRDMVLLSLKTLTDKDNSIQAVSTFAQIAAQPEFPMESFRREKNQQLQAIEQNKQSPDTVATEAFFMDLYQQHPYAHPILGTTASVQGLTREQVIQFYKRYFVAKNAIIVLVGAIDTNTAHEIAEQITHKLPLGEPAKPIPKALEIKKEAAIAINYPSSQTMIRLGQLGINHHDPDYFPLTVGNYILGGGSLVSRLAIEVREKRGLTYGVYSQFLPLPGDGPFLISLSTKNNSAKEALNVTMDTLKNFLTQGATEKELMAAKKYLTGSFPLSLAGNTNIALMLLKIAFYHLPDDYLDSYIKNIEAVNLEEIKNAFQKTVQVNKLLYVTVGPQIEADRSHHRG